MAPATDYPARITVLRDRLSTLLSAEPSRIREILNNKPAAFDVPGAYAIATPDDSRFVYAGKTRTKTVLGRIRDHRSIDTQSDLRGMLKCHLPYPQEIDSYLVRSLEEKDARLRTFLEHFVIGVLQPPFNK